MVDLLAVVIQIVVGIIVVAPVLWLVGRWLAGKDKAKFTDAIWIVVIGTIIGVIVGALIGTSFISALISAIIMFIVWLGLIKHFFDVGWLRAFAIAVVAVIIFIVIVMILALIGIGIFALGFGGL